MSAARTIHHPGEHQRIVDDGVAYCGWAGDGGIYHGCGVLWTPGHDVDPDRARVVDRNGLTVDYETLPLTQQLALETLAARYRLGETLWTFSRKTRPVLEALETRGLVWAMGGIVERTVRAGLTAAGQTLMLSDNYVPPILRGRG